MNGLRQAFQDVAVEWLGEPSAEAHFRALVAALDRVLPEHHAHPVAVNAHTGKGRQYIWARDFGWKRERVRLWCRFGAWRDVTLSVDVELPLPGEEWPQSLGGGQVQWLLGRERHLFGLPGLDGLRLLRNPDALAARLCAEALQALAWVHGQHATPARCLQALQRDLHPAWQRGPLPGSPRALQCQAVLSALPPDVPGTPLPARPLPKKR